MSQPAPFYENYTRLVPETDVLAALQRQLDVDFPRMLAITEEQGNTVHPPYTWSIKQVLGHLIDGEVVFAYRAFRFSRQDATPLAGFDDQQFVNNSNYPQRTVRDLMDQLSKHRQANLAMFGSLPEPAWNLSGTAAGLEWRVIDLAKVMVGHIRHHQAILDKRCS